MIIDFHTHIFPDKIAEKAVAVLEENTFKCQGARYDAVIPATLDALKRSMRGHGIDISVVMPIATSVTQYASINRFAAQINGSDGVYSFGSLHPMQDNWEETLYDIKDKGLCGIKLHPEYQKFYIDSPESVRILKKCEELDLAVMLHAGYDIGVNPPAHCLPERLRRALGFVSGEKIIAAHMGGWRAWDDVEKYLVGTPVYIDTSYAVFDMDKPQILRIIRNHGSEKILFATDSPWKSQGETVSLIRSLGLNKDELDNILCKNAKKLLKI